MPIIIDATGIALGRLASYSAKKAVLGEEVCIINCDNGVISGKRKNVVEAYLTKRARRHPFSGPFISRVPSMIVKRAIRGMLEYKRTPGKLAFQRVVCYNTAPNEIIGKQEDIDKLKKSYSSYVTLKELSSSIS